MSYTQQLFLDDEAEFPTPPLWLVWEEDWHWERKSSTHVKGPGGQVRHMYTLSKAKKRVSGYGNEFRRNWSIYEWDGTKYVRRYQGFEGDLKKDHPLFQVRLKEGLVSGPRDVSADEFDATIASILNASP